MSLNIHEFTVSRQSRCFTGEQVVEISQGGIDYTNADALCAKYEGEFETFTGMKPAVEAGIAIAKAWSADSTDTIHIGVGCTGGYSMPFEEKPATEDNFSALLESADEFDAKLPRCGQCGEILEDTKYGDADIGEYNCCSEYCAERYWSPEEEEEDDGAF